MKVMKISSTLRSNHSSAVMTNTVDITLDIDKTSDLLINYLLSLIEIGRSALALEVISSLAKLKNFELKSQQKKNLVKLYILANNSLDRYPQLIDKDSLENMVSDHNHQLWKDYLSKKIIPESNYLMIS